MPVQHAFALYTTLRPLTVHGVRWKAAIAAVSQFVSRRMRARIRPAFVYLFKNRKAASVRGLFLKIKYAVIKKSLPVRFFSCYRAAHETRVTIARKVQKSQRTLFNRLQVFMPDRNEPVKCNPLRFWFGDRSAGIKYCWGFPWANPCYSVRFARCSIHFGVQINRGAKKRPVRNESWLPYVRALQLQK
jgi:hypothetical protein